MPTPTLPENFVRPDANQIWDQSWWDANPEYLAYINGTPQAPGVPETPRAGGIQINPSQPYGPGGNLLDPPGGATQPGSGQAGFGTIKTSIKPQGVFTSAQTRLAKNQSVADWHKRAAGVNMKQFDQKGISRGANTMYRAMPGIASAYSGAANAAATIPLSDEVANQRNMLAGQIGQGNEWAGLANILLGQHGLNNYTQQQNMQSMVPLLQSIMGLL